MSNENPYNIKIKELQMGNDYTFIITGAVAHVGANAIAYWVGGEIEAHLIELPHHKEGRLAKECAIYSAKALGCTVAISMGIHIDNATKEQINEIVDYVRKAMKERVEFLASKKNTPQ